MSGEGDGLVAMKALGSPDIVVQDPEGVSHGHPRITALVIAGQLRIEMVVGVELEAHVVFFVVNSDQTVIFVNTKDEVGVDKHAQGHEQAVLDHVPIGRPRTHGRRRSSFNCHDENVSGLQQGDVSYEPSSQDEQHVCQFQ